MSIEQPLHRHAGARPPAPHADALWAPERPRSVEQPHGPAWPSYPPPEQFGWRTLHPATPPAGFAPPWGMPPTAPAPPPYPVSGFLEEGPRGGGGALAVVALVCGSVALLTSWLVWVSFAALALALGGLICGVIALQRATRRRGIAIAGVSISGLALVIALLTSALVLLGVAVTSSDTAADPGGPAAPSAPGLPTGDRWSSSGDPGSSAGDTALPTRGVSNDSPDADRLLLEVLDSQGIVIEDDQAVRLGRGVCGSWEDGADVMGQVDVVSRSGLSDYDSAFLVGLATVAYCPAYEDRIFG